MYGTHLHSATTWKGRTLYCITLMYTFIYTKSIILIYANCLKSVWQWFMWIQSCVWEMVLLDCPLIISLIQAMCFSERRVYTPGFLGSPHPLPPDTRPTIFLLHSKGPPESPWNDNNKHKRSQKNACRLLNKNFVWVWHVFKQSVNNNILKFFKDMNSIHTWQVSCCGFLLPAQSISLEMTGLLL